jgi:hypothetical protein
MGFGGCPSDYKYTMQVWNDLSVAIDAFFIGVIKVQGAGYNSTSYAQQCAIPPYSYANPSNFNNINACYGIVNFDVTPQGQTSCPKFPTGQVFYSRPSGQTPQGRGELTDSFGIGENDPNVYVYHAFQTSESTGPEGEFMGPGLYGGPYITTDQFDGVFFNKSPYEAQVSFKKNGQTYKVSLESMSFNLLSSDSWIQDSVRSSTEGRNFTFNVNNKAFTLPVNPIGLGDTFYDPTANTTQNIPLTYTYEIYQNQNDLNVAIQGFNMGNHNQLGILDISSSTTPTVSTLTAIRDINPVDCYVWVQTPEQYQALQSQDSTNGKSASSGQAPYSMPGSLWAIYQTNDSNISQQLTSGQWQNNHFTVIRPQVSESRGYMYIFSLNTTDTGKASQFLTNTLKTTDLASTFSSTVISSAQIPTTLGTQLVPNTNGIFSDTQSGVTGALLLTDTFVPYGGGSKMPRYYLIPPALLQVNVNFVSVITSWLDPQQFNADPSQAATQMTADVTQKLPEWLTTFNQNKGTLNASQITLANVSSYSSQLQGVVPDLTSYLQEKGKSALFTDATVSPSSRTFSTQGQKALYLILFGPLSLNSPPLLQLSGSNAYLGLQPGQLPKNWPTG